jgi:hypothetical protein
MPVLRAMPLFVLLWAAYNILVLAGQIPAVLDAKVLTLALSSGAVWSMTVADLLIALGVLVLYVEMFRATRTGMSSVVNHTLSALVFAAFLVEFIMVEAAGTSVFFLLTLMTFVDVVAGFTISIVAARRDFGVGGGVGS